MIYLCIFVYCLTNLKMCIMDSIGKIYFDEIVACKNYYVVTNDYWDFAILFPKEFSKRVSKHILHVYDFMFYKNAFKNYRISLSVASVLTKNLILPF